MMHLIFTYLSLQDKFHEYDIMSQCIAVSAIYYHALSGIALHTPSLHIDALHCIEKHSTKLHSTAQSTQLQSNRIITVAYHDLINPRLLHLLL